MRENAATGSFAISGLLRRVKHAAITNRKHVSSRATSNNHQQAGMYKVGSVGSVNERWDEAGDG